MASRPRVLVVITRADIGGAVIHMLGLITALEAEVEFHLAVGPDDALADRAARSGAQLHRVQHLVRTVSPIDDARAVAGLVSLVRRLDPDVIHAHTFKAGLASRLAGLITRTPVIYTPHGWRFSDGNPWLWRLIGPLVEASLACATAKVICVSLAEMDAATNRRVLRPDKAAVIHNGITDSPLRAGMAERSGSMRIVVVARMAPPKDHETVLRALAGVAFPYDLLLIGDGPRRPALEALARRLGVADRVRFLGARLDVARLLQDAEVLVLSSFSEGFPLTVLEGMRAGLPVVATAVGGVPEAVSDGETGILVPPGDSAALAAALEALAHSADLRRRMGLAGRQVYEARFRLEQQSEATLQIYREVIAGVHGAVGTARMSGPSR